MASIFSQILAGNLPGHFVWKDDTAFAIMTIRPLRPGHVLLMPRQEIDQWDDVPAPLMTHLMNVSKQIAQAIKQAFPCARVGLAICGLEVPHTHIHLFPIDTIEDFDFGKGDVASSADLADAAEHLRAALIANGCGAASNLDAVA
ncbi:MAG: Histidine triad family protein [Verrucomicrobiaceae bacterium]|nr:Histidine triad family protein [Verrucomicrobiaceae bacterium]